MWANFKQSGNLPLHGMCPCWEYLQCVENTLFLSMQLILIKDDTYFNFTSIYVTEEDPTFLMEILGLLLLERRCLTETREMLGETLRLLVCLEAVQSARFMWQESVWNEWLRWRSCNLFLTSIPQCHLAVFLLVNLSSALSHFAATNLRESVRVELSGLIIMVRFGNHSHLW